MKSSQLVLGGAAGMIPWQQDLDGEQTVAFEIAGRPILHATSLPYATSFLYATALAAVR